MNAFKHCTIHHFTDDTSFLYANKNIQNIEVVMNSELKRFANWIFANKLSLEEPKTQFIFSYSARKHHHTVSNIKLDNFVKNQFRLMKYFHGIIKRKIY